MKIKKNEKTGDDYKKCDYCGKFFYIRSLKRHINEVHEGHKVRDQKEMGDTDNEKKCEYCGISFKNLKKHIRKSHQIPKIKKDNENLANDEEYSVEKVLGKRLGKKGTIGKLLTIFILENIGLPISFQLLYFPSRIFVEMERL